MTKSDQIKADGILQALFTSGKILGKGGKALKGLITKNPLAGKALRAGGYE